MALRDRDQGCKNRASREMGAGTFDGLGMDRRVDEGKVS